MKKYLISLAILLLAFFSVNSFAQDNVKSTKDGETMYYSKPFLIKLDLLMHIQVEYRLVALKKGNQDLGYAFYVTPNYDNPSASKDKAILFRLSNQEVIRCQAMRDYGEDDRTLAQNATNNASNRKFLEAFYMVTEEDLNKLMTGVIIKMRVEFDNVNIDLDEKRCKSIPKHLATSYKFINDLKTSNVEKF